jgi:hypothetical protein
MDNKGGGNDESEAQSANKAKEIGSKTFARIKHDLSDASLLKKTGVWILAAAGGLVALMAGGYVYNNMDKPKTVVILIAIVLTGLIWGGALWLVHYIGEDSNTPRTTEKYSGPATPQQERTGPSTQPIPFVGHPESQPPNNSSDSSSPKNIKPPTSTTRTTMPVQLKETFQRLRQGFETLALQSNGLFHVLVERQQGPTIVAPKPETPPGLSAPPGSPGTKTFFHFGSPPGDPATIKELSVEESRNIGPDTNDRMYFRDLSKRAWGVLEPSVIRTEYIHGDGAVYPKFEALADGVGTALLGVPTDIIARLPIDIRPLFRPRMRADRRYRFGDFPFEPIPVGCLAQTWNPAAMQFEHGIIIDFPGAVTGNDRALSKWMLLIHRLGWEADPGRLLYVASRWFWTENVSVSIDIPVPRSILGNIPRSQWYSVLSPDSGSNATDVCRASAWAIDYLMDLMS